MRLKDKSNPADPQMHWKEKRNILPTLFIYLQTWFRRTTHQTFQIGLFCF